MPNWIEGCLKLRGPGENILRFFREGISAYRYVGPPTDDYEKVPQDFWYAEDITMDPSVDSFENHGLVFIQREGVFIEDTRRAFIDEQTIELLPYKDKPCMIASIRIRQAWCFEPQDFLGIARKYGFDVRMYGIECGEQFCQELCIENGELILNKKTEYNDWEWECPFPRMGG